MADVRSLAWLIKVNGASEAGKAVEGFDNKIDNTKSKMFSFSDSLKNIGGGLKSIGGKISGAGDSVSKLGGKITKMTLPLTVAGTKAFKWANDLDKAIRQVSTLTSDGILPVDKIKKEVLDISDATGIAQSDVANAMYEALSAGVDESKVVDFTKKAINLTEAGFTDLSTAIDATTTILNAYGDKAFDVSKVSDILVKTQDKGKITVDELAGSIGRVIPTAAAAGVNVDQLGAAYSILTAKGMNARIATTNLEGMLSELSTTGSKTDTILRLRTGKSFAQLTEEGTNLGKVLGIIDGAAKESGLTLKDMFGQSTAGSAALSLLSDGVEGYTAMLGTMNNAQGATDKNAEKMKGNAYTWQKAVNKMKNTMIDLGDAIAPVLIPIADKIGELTNRFRELSPETKEKIVQFGLMAVAAGPLLVVGGKLISGIGTMISVAGTVIHVFGFIASFVLPALGSAISFICSPIGLVVGAASALIAIGVHLVRDWKNIKKRANELGGGLKGYLCAALESTGRFFTNLRDKAVGALNKIKGAWGKLKEFVKHPIKGTVGFIGKLLGVKGDSKEDVPSHAKGLDRVPHDNYMANLHSGEMILTEKTAAAYRALGGSRDNVPVYNVNNSERSYESAPNVTINIDVKGSADSQTVLDIAEQVRTEIDNVFRKLSLQRA